MAQAEPDHDVIEPLVCELVIPGVLGRDWAAEMEKR